MKEKSFLKRAQQARDSRVGRLEQVHLTLQLCLDLLERQSLCSQLAHTLVDQMVTSIGEIEMRDRYSEALKEIIEAKIEGKEVAGFVEEEQPTVDIMTALKESIKQAQRKPMVKATGKANKQEAKQEEVEEAKPKKARKSKAS